MIFLFFLTFFFQTSAYIRKLSDSELVHYKKYGYVLCKKLINDTDLDFIVQEANNSIYRNSGFQANFYKKIEFNTLINNSKLKNITTHLPAKQIMDYSSNAFTRFMGGKPRVLKDAFLVFAPGFPGCGYHVDDEGFWPTPIHHFGHEGINIWIALSQYRKSHGGGLALSKNSHKSKYFKKARSLIRKTKNGFGRTCELSILDPHIYEHFNNQTITFDMEPGDAIIHGRWIFHKSVQFSQEGIDSFTHPLMRYSIRYMPENSLSLEKKKKLKFFDDLYPVAL